MRRLFAPLLPVWNLCCLTYYQAVLAQINPLHPDVPEIVLKIRALELQRSAA